MKAKTKLGMGITTGKNKIIKFKKKKSGGALTLNSAIALAKKALKNTPESTMINAISIALNAIGKIKKKSGKLSSSIRVIPVPKSGGFLPLIPIFAALSAIGALSGGAASIAKAVNAAKTASENLKEAQRHNQMMESIAMGKGLYLKPYKSGLGLFLAPTRKIQNFP